jgi:secreted trypsin-like serine protease
MRLFLMFLVFLTTPAFAIVNGSRVSPSSQIGQAVVFLFSPVGEGCSGTLIARDTILTAAHCIKSSKQLVFLRNSDGSRVTIEVKASAKHPSYRPFTPQNKKLALDLAVVVLKQAVPAPFAPIALSGGAAAGASITIAGWGRETQDKGANFGVLQSTSIEAVREMTPNHLALVDPSTKMERVGRGACSGDSGGPAIYNGGIAGVLSMATGAGERGCGGLTLIVTVDNHIGWINATMRRLGGGR